LAPQLGGLAHESLPELHFFAGRGRVRFFRTNLRYGEKQRAGRANDRGLTAKLLLFVSVLRTSREVKLR
jgi:hypothetical protein